MEKIIIKNSYNENLVGYLHKTDNKKLIIVCHGRLCTKDEYFIPELCNSLQTNNLNAFRFDFSGNGESEGNFEDCTISKEVEDIKSVVDYFRKLHYDIFCLIGHSKGAVAVLLHQSTYNSAKFIIEISGLVNQEFETTKKYSDDQIKEINENGFTEIKYNNKTFKISKKYFDDRLSYGDIRDYVKKIKVPVLVIHGTNDEDTDYKNGQLMIESLNKNSDLVSIENADHFFSKHQNELTNNIIEWLKNKN